MLSPHDEELVNRDRSIPGLRTLLDPEALAEALKQALPGIEIGAVRPAYVRYKPGMNCLVAYNIEVNGTEIAAYAKAHRPDANGPLQKASAQPGVAGPLGPGRLVLEGDAIVISVFPNDGEIKALSRLAEPDSWTSLLHRIFSHEPQLWEGSVRSIRYKPERRYVAQLVVDGAPKAVLKVYTENGYPEAKQSARTFNTRKASGDLLVVPQRLGHSDKHHVLAFQWAEGDLLSDLLLRRDVDYAALERVGTALSEAHRLNASKLPQLTRESEASILLSVASGLSFLCPHLADRVNTLARRLSALLLQEPLVSRPVHGDFYAKQVLLAGERVVILDFDSAVAGDPAFDLGLFIAHLERGALRHTVRRDSVVPAADALLSGYRAATDMPVAEQKVGLYVAAGLLKLAPHPFRNLHPDWPAGIEATLARAEAKLNKVTAPTAVFGLAYGNDSDKQGQANQQVSHVSAPVVAVSNPHSVTADPSMPFLAQALNPLDVHLQFRRRLSGFIGEGGKLQLLAIRAVRHKPGRRCLIEYDVAIDRPGQEPKVATLVGKARARGLDKQTYEAVRLLWQSGFGDRSEDGISVPQPVGMVPEFQMWLQLRLPGEPASRLLSGDGGEELGRRIAEAAHKLHTARVRPTRKHTIADELRILHERLPLVSRLRPDWEGRIERLLAAADRLGSSLPRPRSTGVHRDFYADQVLVDGERLYLLDFDLYCEGDPALDIGNFLGHIQEQSLRTFGDAHALANVEEAMTERFVELSGEQTRRATEVYTTLTLLRHIQISTRFPGRQHFTAALLDLCEERLARHIVPVRPPVAPSQMYALPLEGSAVKPL